MVHLIISDLSGPTPEAVAEVMAAVDRTGSSVSLLVNNAGTFREPPFLEMDYKDYQHTMRLNVDAGFFLTQAIARRWVAGGVLGRVLFTGSINGLLAEADHAAYDTSKGAVASMVRTLCVALAPRGIRVNGVAPGLVRTPLTNQILSVDRDAMRWMQLHTPNGQVPDADVVGPAAVFLMSDEADHVQGQMLWVDYGADGLSREVRASHRLDHSRWKPEKVPRVAWSWTKGRPIALSMISRRPTVRKRAPIG